MAQTMKNQILTYPLEVLLVLLIVLPGCEKRTSETPSPRQQTFVHVSPDSVGAAEIVYGIENDTLLETVTLYRSSFDFNDMPAIDLSAYPVTAYKLATDSFSGAIRDTIIAPGVRYYYYLHAVPVGSKTAYRCSIATTLVPRRPPARPPEKCFILIDKKHYVLEIRSGPHLIRSYPISLGRNPVRRKLFRDNLSTPEGEYHVAYTNLNSSFYKSLMLDYPNSVDRQRYDSALQAGTVLEEEGRPVGIGGDIAIHGGGLGNNWTWGCIAVENDVMDEILSMPCVQPGMKVLITGEEVSRESLLQW